MSFKPIIIVSGEPYGIFNEIFLKVIKKYSFKKPLILIGSKINLLKEAKKNKTKVKLNLLNKDNFKLENLNKKKINLINVHLKSKKGIKRYIQNCFDIGLSLAKKYHGIGFINGPINKKTFLKFKFQWITEYLAKDLKCKNYAMLIYTKKIAVCPITTHLPLKKVYKSISRKKIVDKVKLINNFYKTEIKKTPKIAITGLNPHCESGENTNEEKKNNIPAGKILRKNKISIEGPFSADTIFIEDQIKKFDVIVGMYHDQVLGPIKALYNFEAINITLGLPFLRVSPDHGPNQKMFGKNLSNPESLLQAIKFLDT